MAICDTHKIDSNATGLRFAFEECIGELPQGAGVAASGTLTFTGNPQASDTVEVGGQTYLFVASLSVGPEVPYEVLIGVDAEATATNLAAAVNEDVGEGTAYSAGTVANPAVSATVAGAVVTVTARVAGAAGNAIALATDSAGVLLSDTNLSGGEDGTVWYPLEPNSYSDFGASVETLARSFISEGRQRKKGVITSVTASGGFNQDLTQTNAQQLLSAFLFADIRTKNSYLIEGTLGQLSVTKTAGQFARIVGADFAAAGLIPGEWIFVGGDAAAERFDNEANNGFKRVREVTDTYIVIDKSDLPMVAEAAASKTITIYLGRVLKNESARADIVRKSMQFERTLGSLDGLEPPQAEYLIGAVASEMTLNMPMQDKITADFSFIAIDHETRTQEEGLKDGARPDLEEADAFNTSDHVRRIRIGLANEPEEATDDLFGYATDLSISVNNTLTPLNAIGRSVAFEVTAGTFAVSGSVEAYFSDIRAVRAVRNNEDITLDCILVREGAGIVIDMPLTSLGGGQANVVLDQPIMLPLTSEAATGAKIDAGLNHTLLFMFFDVLPSWAE